MHRVHDVLIAGTTAEVRRDGVANLRLGWLRMIPKEGGQRHQHSRRAEAALQAMRVAKRGLERIEAAVRRRKSFNCLNGVPVRLHGEHDAGARGFAVKEDGAGAAHTVLAPNVGAGESEVLSQKIAEQQARLDAALIAHSVDCDVDVDEAHATAVYFATRGVTSS